MRRLLLGLLLVAVTQAGSAQPSPSGLPRLTDVGREAIALSGRAPQGLDVDLGSGLVYVSNNGNVAALCQGNGQGVPSSMSIVDPGLRRETVRVDAMAGPVWPLVDSRRDVVYSANSGGKSLTIHARGSGALLASVPLGGRPHQVGLDPERSLLVISNTNDETRWWMPTRVRWWAICPSARCPTVSRSTSTDTSPTSAAWATGPTPWSTSAPAGSPAP